MNCVAVLQTRLNHSSRSSIEFKVGREFKKTFNLVFSESVKKAFNWLEFLLAPFKPLEADKKLTATMFGYSLTRKYSD